MALKSESEKKNSINEDFKNFLKIEPISEIPKRDDVK